jgi:hypothetical protein
MTTIYPPATQVILPEAATQDKIVPVLVIYHTIVGSAKGAIAGMLRSDTPGESHLVNPNDGRMVQLMPFNVRADCNWRVNSWVTQVDIPLANGKVVPRLTKCGAISIESEDDGTPEDTPWTLAQCEAFAQFSAWAYLNLNIPIARPSDPFQAGTGYHSLPGLNRLAVWEPNASPPFGTFIDPKGRTVNVYNPWTNTVGKSCPGPARIAQFDGILARARAIASPLPPPPPPVPSPPSQETTRMILVVARKDAPTDTRRWAWDGVTVRLIPSEDEFLKLYVGPYRLFNLHPAYNNLAAPYLMTDAELNSWANPAGVTA